jgi:DHA1 family inner membrane transport protein
VSGSFRSDTPKTEKGETGIRGLVWKVGAATLSRLCLNTARRFAYPFAPVLSRELGVPLTAITSLIAVNQATGLLGVFFGPLGDRFGYRLMMLVGLGMLVVGMFAGGLLPFYGVVLAALFLAGMGKSLFDPALQAYVGERVPFRRRGLVIGVLEMSWAGSTLVGIPLVGLLMDGLGWRSPFFVMAGVGLVGMVTLGVLIPGDGVRSGGGPKGIGYWKSWRGLVRERPALGTLSFAFLVSVANDNLFVIYGAWLEESFGLSVVALGMGTVVIGAAELLGETLTASLADRLGLKRSVIIGLVLSGLGYVMLPFLRDSLPWALFALFVVFLTLEFGIVACLSISTEVLPESRATMMAAVIAAAGLGRVVGAFLGGPVWVIGGLTAIGLVSAGISALALALFVWGLKDWQ